MRAQLALSDAELSAVMSAAAPLRPCDRDPLLPALAWPRRTTGLQME